MTTHPPVCLDGTTTRPDRRDGGFTVSEVTIVVALLASLISATSMALIVTLRAAPTTEQRIDDARATRGLATWLSYDTTSTPPFHPAQPQGGMALAESDGNVCEAPGSNLLHLEWTEDAAVARTFVANYRFVLDGVQGRIVRYTCVRTGTGGFDHVRELALASGLDPASPPTVALAQPEAGTVESVEFSLVGLDGETVLVETSSRNPSESFS